MSRSSAVTRCTLLLVLLGWGCASQGKLQQPFLVLHFSDLDLVIENASTIDDVVEKREGDLSFSRIGGSAHFDVEGSGAFAVRGRVFRYADGALQGEGLDKSLGAVRLTSAGEMIPVNLLPLIAR